MFEFPLNSCNDSSNAESVHQKVVVQLPEKDCSVNSKRKIPRNKINSEQPASSIRQKKQTRTSYQQVLSVDLGTQTSINPIVNTKIDTFEAAKKQPVISKSRGQNDSIYGNIKTKTDYNFEGLPKMAWIYIGRVKENTTEDSVLAYLRNKSPDIYFVCDKLESKGSYSSFKIGFNFKYLDTVMNSDYWL